MDFGKEYQIEIMRPGTYNEKKYLKEDIKQAYKNTDWKSMPIFFCFIEKIDHVVGEVLDATENRGIISVKVLIANPLVNTMIALSGQVDYLEFGIAPNVSVETIEDTGGTKLHAFKNLSFVLREPVGRKSKFVEASE